MYISIATLRDITNLVMASTPALAVAEGTTKPDPYCAYVVVIARKLAPVINNRIKIHCK